MKHGQPQLQIGSLSQKKIPLTEIPDLKSPPLSAAAKITRFSHLFLLFLLLGSFPIWILRRDSSFSRSAERHNRSGGRGRKERAAKEESGKGKEGRKHKKGRRKEGQPSLEFGFGISVPATKFKCRQTSLRHFKDGQGLTKLTRWLNSGLCTAVLT